MSWAAAMQLAIKALWRNRTRAMLTTLGVIIGVASVITMVSVGTGAQQRISAQLASMGTNSLVVRPGSVTRGGVRTGAGTTSTLTLADTEAIKDLPGVIAVAPSIRSSAQVRYRATNWGTAVEGVTPDYFQVRNWPIAEGEFFTDQHVNSAAHVCVLGQTVSQELFGITNPVGKTIVMKGVACKVLGVLTEKGASGWGSDQDDRVFLPLTTVQRKLMGVTHIDHLEVETSGRDTSFQVMDELKRLLRKRHRIPADQPEDFVIHNRAELAQTSEESARVFTWLLASIASVSLLVGGIGIMNIMLVSVTERTHEIGIRMALGARRRDVLWQFLLEAVVLSGAGGILGIILGFVAAVSLSQFSQLPVSITPWSIVVAFLFAAMVGIFFGLHPARKASRLRPIEALRYE